MEEQPSAYSNSQPLSVDTHTAREFHPMERGALENSTSEQNAHALHISPESRSPVLPVSSSPSLPTPVRTSHEQAQPPSDRQGENSAAESHETAVSENENPPKEEEATSRHRFQEAFPKWPFEGKTLEHGWKTDLGMTIFDTILLLIPPCFIVFAILGEVLNGKSVASNPWGKTLITLKKYAVTAYQILFAAVGGRGLKMIATWFTARGARIELLEQLFGSTSVVGTANTIYKLRPYNLVAVALVSMWALSPVGSQAILRLLEAGNRSSSAQGPVYFISSSITSNASEFLGASDWLTDSFFSVYQASLIAPNATQRSPQDFWGNLKTPSIEKLNANSVSPDGWITVPQEPSYSSLVGIPIANLSTEGTSQFMLPSSYFTLNCPEGAQVLPWNEEVLWTEGGGGVLRGNTSRGITGFGSIRVNNPSSNGIEEVPNNYWSVGTFTSPRAPWYRPPTEPMSIYFQFVTINSTNTTQETSGNKPTKRQNDSFSNNIIITNNTNFTQDLTVLNCRLTFTNVQSQVQCGGKSCHVVSMKQASNSTPESSYATPLDQKNGAQTFFDTFALTSGQDLLLNDFNKNSFLMQYLKYGFNPIGTPNYNTYIELSAIPGPLLVERLSRLMNSLWLPSLSLEFLTGNFPPDLNAVTGIDSSLATITTTEEIYLCSTVWFVFLLLSATVLFAVALVGTWLKYFRTVAPDIVGHISSLTRDNPYVKIPGGGSSLSGFKRARYLKDVEIKIADLKPDDEVGRIVIMSVDEANPRGSGHELGRKRKYE